MKINYNFEENSAFLEIIGDESIQYQVHFLNLENNDVVYTTKLQTNNWASSSRKTDCIRVYDDKNNLIFERINNLKDAMNFNNTSISFMGALTPKELFENIEDNIKDPIAILCPHAGFYFSGKVAAKSFSVIDKERKYNNIFILSTSHTDSYFGASLCSNQYYNTPFGALQINNDICNELNSNELKFNNDHFKNDHTINMILPFIQERIKPGYKIVPIMIGDSDVNNLNEISKKLKPYFTENNLFVISSDFSHYPLYNDAVEVDNETKDAILSNDINIFLNTVHNINKPNLVTRMCGWSSCLILLYLLKDKNVKINVEDYKNSGDITGDRTNGVVGYYAINFCLEKITNNNERKILTDIVRKTIKQYLDNGSIYEPVRPNSEILNSNRGAFVTLHLDGHLKGCIGLFWSNYELYKVVRNMAISSAFNDSRFTPLTKEEYDKIDIEISILSPFKKITDINQIKLGKHGIYISKNSSSGTFLPQVATETGWNLEEFLGHCSQDKAGLGWYGWKDAEIFTYEAEVFSEEKYMKEASYYNILNDNIVECILCPHNCKIKESQFGICLSRKNENGILYATSYNNLACVAVDPIEKKPFRNFMSGTKTYSISAGGCNFKCLNCQNYGISQETPEKVIQHKMTPHDVVSDAIKHNCPSISYTYTEPSTFYEMMIDTAKLAHKEGLKNCMVSNGYINEEPLRELCKYIDAFNIDLKSFSDDIYKRLNKGTLEPVLKTLQIIKENNRWLEITFLIIPEWTDDLNMVKDMFNWLYSNGFSETPIHFIGFFPTYKMMDTPHATHESVERIKQIAIDSGMKNIR